MTTTLLVLALLACTNQIIELGFCDHNFGAYVIITKNSKAGTYAFAERGHLRPEVTDPKSRITKNIYFFFDENSIIIRYEKKIGRKIFEKNFLDTCETF